MKMFIVLVLCFAFFGCSSSHVQKERKTASLMQHSDEDAAIKGKRLLYRECEMTLPWLRSQTIRIFLNTSTGRLSGYMNNAFGEENITNTVKVISVGSLEELNKAGYTWLVKSILGYHVQGYGDKDISKIMLYEFQYDTPSTSTNRTSWQHRNYYFELTGVNGSFERYGAVDDDYSFVACRSSDDEK